MKSWIVLLLIIFFGKFSLLKAVEINISENPEQLPWLTGTLIAPSPTVVPKGRMSAQPYVFIKVNTGFYDKNWCVHSKPKFVNVSSQVSFAIGLTPWMDFRIRPRVEWNTSQGRSSVHFGDLPLGVDFQLLEEGNYLPSIKLGILERFPTGNYQKLSPHKKNTDSSGTGSFTTIGLLVFHKVFQFSYLHYLSSSFSFEWFYEAPVKVKGFNTYGGGFGTHGKIRAGSTERAILSLEYTLNQNWVVALDSIYRHSSKVQFSGFAGHEELGAHAQNGGPSSEDISFAPALEYNFNVNAGIIAGAWFTVAGRNSPEFRSAVISYSRVF